MLRVIQFFGTAQRFSGNLLGLPLWARIILMIVALPGLILVGLSLAAVLVSLSALLLLTLPTYRLLWALARGGSQRSREPGVDAGSFPSNFGGLQDILNSPAGRRHVDVKVIPPPDPNQKTEAEQSPGGVSESDYG